MSKVASVSTGRCDTTQVDGIICHMFTFGDVAPMYRSETADGWLESSEASPQSDSERSKR
ncbi:MAG: hypothetical protein CMJ18_06925 [Phycisphaeraceae bacterium]|nr:hypothetical protein [Phycisphaeraceae bacterium]